MLGETARERGEKHLSLGVSKARVEFEHTRRSIRKYHQARVQHAFVGGALRRNFAEHRLKDVGADSRQQLVAGDADWAICPHPTGVRTGVAFAEPFVILRGREQYDAVAVGQAEDGQLFAVEELLNEQLLTCLAQRTAQHRPRDIGRLLARLADDRAFPRRQT